MNVENLTRTKFTLVVTINVLNIKSVLSLLIAVLFKLYLYVLKIKYTTILHYYLNIVLYHG